MKKDPVEQAEEKIRARLGDLIERALDLAMGVVVEEYVEEDGDVVKRVYQRPPDRAALMYVLDRVMGKPAQRVEMTGQGGVVPVIIPMMLREEAERQGLVERLPQLPAPGDSPSGGYLRDVDDED